MQHITITPNGIHKLLQYSSTCLGRPPSWAATCLVRPRYQCPDRHISTLNYLWSAANCNERTLLPGPEGIRSWQVLLYAHSKNTKQPDQTTYPQSYNTCRRTNTHIHTILPSLTKTRNNPNRLDHNKCGPHIQKMRPSTTQQLPPHFTNIHHL